MLSFFVFLLYYCSIQILRTIPGCCNTSLSLLSHDKWIAARATDVGCKFRKGRRCFAVLVFALKCRRRSAKERKGKERRHSLATPLQNAQTSSSLVRKRSSNRLFMRLRRARSSHAITDPTTQFFFPIEKVRAFIWLRRPINLSSARSRQSAGRGEERDFPSIPFTFRLTGTYSICLSRLALL
jgi:hypothetical protein